MTGAAMQLAFSIDEHAIHHRRAIEAVARWIRGFALHDAGLALKPAPFTVLIETHEGDTVKSIPADSRERAEELVEQLRIEYATLGIHDFLLKHDAPTRFVERTARPS